MPIAQQSPNCLLPLPSSTSCSFLANPVFALLASLLQKGNRLMDNPSSSEHCLVPESPRSANCNSATASSNQDLARQPHGKLRWFVGAFVILFLIGIGWGALTAFKYTRANLGNWRQQLQARTGSNPLAGDLTPVKKDFYGTLAGLKIVG